MRARKFIPDVEIGSDDLATRSEQIAVRFTPQNVAVLKAEAARLGVGYTTLVRTIVEKWVAGRQRQAA